MVYVRNPRRLQAAWLTGFRREHAATEKMKEQFTTNIKDRPLRASELRGIAKYLEVRSQMYTMYLETATALAARGYPQLLQEVSTTRAAMSEEQRAYREQAAQLASE